MGAVAASAQRGLHLPQAFFSSLRVDPAVNQTPALFFNRKKKKKKERTQNREKAG
jgi:hypothetical protein